MTGKTAAEAWRQMYHELKNASESRDGAYEKVITELREELFQTTADLETAQALLREYKDAECRAVKREGAALKQLDAVREVCEENGYHDVLEALEQK